MLPSRVVGLSDHSLSDVPATLAVAMGASVIEKHIMLADARDPLDAAHSLTPGRFRLFVEAIRDAERAYSGPTEATEAASRAFRRRLVFRADLRAGDTIAPADIRTARCEVGILPTELDGVIGAVVDCDVQAGQPITEDVLAC